MGWLRASGSVLLRPWLWATGIKQALRLAKSGWWRRPPFLPLPAQDYLHFRMQTAYGDAEHPVVAGDLVTYLEWCRRWHREHR